MTKEEVLKGLEICKKSDGGEGCKGCPYSVGAASCITGLMGDAYKLIKAGVIADE